MRSADVRRCLQAACSSHLWCALPEELEDMVVRDACESLDDADIDDSPYGPLFAMAADYAMRYHGGTMDPDNPGCPAPDRCEPRGFSVATAYDTVVTTAPVHGAPLFGGGEEGGPLQTYRLL